MKTTLFIAALLLAGCQTTTMQNIEEERDPPFEFFPFEPSIPTGEAPLIEIDPNAPRPSINV